MNRACKLSMNCIDWAKEDKEFESLHDDPVYKKIVFPEAASEPETKHETVSSAPALTGEEHAVIETGDRIHRIHIGLDVNELFEKYRSKLKQWNQTLDKKFPNLRDI